MLIIHFQIWYVHNIPLHNKFHYFRYHLVRSDLYRWHCWGPPIASLGTCIVLYEAWMRKNIGKTCTDLECTHNLHNLHMYIYHATDMSVFRKLTLQNNRLKPYFCFLNALDVSSKVVKTSKYILRQDFKTNFAHFSVSEDCKDMWNIEFWQQCLPNI